MTNPPANEAPQWNLYDHEGFHAAETTITSGLHKLYNYHHTVNFTPPIKEMCISFDNFQITRNGLPAFLLAYSDLTYAFSSEREGFYTYSFVLMDNQRRDKDDTGQPCQVFCRFNWLIKK